MPLLVPTPEFKPTFGLTPTPALPEPLMLPPVLDEPPELPPL